MILYSENYLNKSLIISSSISFFFVLATSLSVQLNVDHNKERMTRKREERKEREENIFSDCKINSRMIK